MTKARDIASAIPAPSTVSSAELGYLDGVTSAIQTQIDSKIGSASAINPTIVDAKGDIIAATAADTVARLAVGANGTVLTAASGQATGLEWATPASGSMTLLSTTTLSGATVTISSISQAYKSLYMIISGVTNLTSTDMFRCDPNNVGNVSNQICVNTAGTWNSKINTTIRLSAEGAQGSLYTSANNSWAFTINNYTSTTAFKPFSIYGAYLDPGNNHGFASFGSFNSTTAISSLVFSNNGGGDLSTGTVLLYGVN